MSTLPQTRWPVQHESVASHTAPSCWDADSHGFNWYAVYTLTRHEKRVMAQCEERQIEAFLPLYKTRHLWKNRCTVDLELPLFPNYSFVRIDPRKRPQVLQLPGVVAIVSSGRNPLPLSDNYISSLREGLLLYRMEPHPEPAVGDRVRIRSGPLGGAEGVLLRRKNGVRVVLSLEMIARSVSVEVDVGDVELRAVER